MPVPRSIDVSCHVGNPRHIRDLQVNAQINGKVALFAFKDPSNHETFESRFGSEGVLVVWWKT